MNTITSWKVFGLVAALAASAPLLAGCAMDAQDPSEIEEEAAAVDEEGEVGEAASALTCTGAGCTGLNPNNTNCILDQQLKGSNPIKDQNGVQLGTVSLYYSPSCKTIWGYAGFNMSHGSFQLCATNITNLSQPPQCLNYSSSVFGAVSKMQFLRVNDSGYASVFVNSPTLGSGSTPAYTRTF